MAAELTLEEMQQAILELDRRIAANIAEQWAATRELEKKLQDQLRRRVERCERDIAELKRRLA